MSEQPKYPPGVPASGLMKRKQVASHLGISLSQLEKMRASGGGPQETLLDGRILRFRFEDVEYFAQTGQRRPRIAA